MLGFFSWLRKGQAPTNDIHGGRSHLSLEWKFKSHEFFFHSGKCRRTEKESRCFLSAEIKDCYKIHLEGSFTQVRFRKVYLI